MKKILLFIPVFWMCANTPSFSQSHFGFSAGYATSKAFFMDVFFGKKFNRCHLGFTTQFNNAHGKKVDEILPNYGKTLIGTGDFFWTADLGYSRIIKKISLAAELSVGGKRTYENYADDRFKGGAYYIISKDKTGNTLGGIGLGIGFFITKHIELFTGYHTLKKIPIGCRISF